MLVWEVPQDVLSSDWEIGLMDLGGNGGIGESPDVWGETVAVLDVRA